MIVVREMRTVLRTCNSVVFALNRVSKPRLDVTERCHQIGRTIRLRLCKLSICIDLWISSSLVRVML